MTHRFQMGTLLLDRDYVNELREKADKFRWISVTERLPNLEHAGQEILCLINGIPILATVCEGGGIYFCVESVYYLLSTKKWIKDDYYSEVTHWMPLPEVPREKK